ncbi:alpha/beta hydrolase [Lysobacter sp. K5869]|uniref:alpha/beta fold hydrolase n=1 Tax=Lysobacter sp. K5869 TaxID=2820808 RepID=UPI00210125F3|nr:alpha/beta hydrolase [Lysobacter sp. K5869]
MRPLLTAALAASLMLPTVSAAAAPPSAEPQTVRHHTVQVDGVDLFYREAGPKNAPVLVLLHGLPSSSHMFRRLMPLLADRYRVIAPDYPGFGASAAPSPADYDYSFDRLAVTVDRLLEQLRVERYSLYVFDYGAPVGFRLAVAHPERIESLIVQNGNAYEEGMGTLWDPLRAYWQDPTPQRSELIAQKLLSLESTQWHYLHGVRDPAAIAPENWLLDQALLDRPGLREIQLRLLHDYGSNPGRYPAWQAYFRKYQPPTLIVWGKNDPIFLAPGAQAYLRDLPNARLRFYDTGHFALEEDLVPIAAEIGEFMDRHVKPRRD